MENIKKRGKLKMWIQMLGLTAVFMMYPVSALKGHWQEVSVDPQTGDSIRPRIALTFDDGPSAKYTPVLLDGLKERNVKATFFVIGSNIEKDGNEALIKRMQDEGHLIGNHTYHHVDLSGLNAEDAHREIEMTEQLIFDITGKETSVVRPPFGKFQTGSEEPDKLYVKWTVDSSDWQTKNTPEIVRKVVTEAGENDIILMHDCYETSVEAALQIIDVFQEKDYEFVTVDQLLIE